MRVQNIIVLSCKLKTSVDWSWIKKIGINNDTVYLEINQYPTFTLLLEKDKLTEDEIAFFEERM